VCTGKVLQTAVAVLNLQAEFFYRKIFSVRKNFPTIFSKQFHGIFNDFKITTLKKINGSAAKNPYPQ